MRAVLKFRIVARQNLARRSGSFVKNGVQHTNIRTEIDCARENDCGNVYDSIEQQQRYLRGRQYLKPCFI